MRTTRYPRLQDTDWALLKPEVYASCSQDLFDSKRRWIVLILDRRYREVECNLSNREEKVIDNRELGEW